MSRGSRARRGFTLIEALAAAVLLGVGVAAAMGALASITRAEAAARDTDTLRRLAAAKLDEVVGLRDLQGASTEGGFDGAELRDARWRLEIVPAGAENLDRIRVTVERGGREAAAETLVFSPPASGVLGG
ncbi:MAG TPA: type II secretion system protein [Fimbriimonadaceae bacterium]|nr:type II secretion system protein [Fimbriimonadaceae bacterium]HRJ97821.1 type II secretion system protein [Fimbriimonadaceae bacterium]